MNKNEFLAFSLPYDVKAIDTFSCIWTIHAYKDALDSLKDNEHLSYENFITEDGKSIHIKEKALPVQTIEAEVERNARWFLRTAGASFRLAFQYLEENKLLDLLDDASAIPGRLKKFSEKELKKAYSSVFKRVSQIGRTDAVFC